MARKRDYRAEYARRVSGTKPGSAARQAARGHKLPKGVPSEYARRVAGTKPGSEERARAAGQRGYSALLRSLGEGDIVSIDPGSERDAQGRWTVVEVRVLDADGKERVFIFRNVTEERVRALVDRAEAVGVIPSPAYPLSKLLPEAAVEGPYLEATG